VKRPSNTELPWRSARPRPSSSCATLLSSSSPLLPPSWPSFRSSPRRHSSSASRSSSAGRAAPVSPLHHPILALYFPTDRCRPVLCIHHSRWPDNGGGNVSPASLLPLSSPAKPTLGHQSSAESSAERSSLHLDHAIAEQSLARTLVRRPRPPSLGPSTSPPANPSHSRLSTLPETSTTARL
jgi:hypothetical protein